MPALGERFRAAREARGLSLSDVAEQIRIRSVYLGAIEDENWSAIGAPVYIRGFLRTYARFLGLDPEETVAEFNGSSAAVLEPSAAAAAGEAYAVAGRSSRSLSPVIWVATLVAIVLVAFVFYNELTLRSRVTAESAVTAGSASPLPSNATGSPEPGVPIAGAVAATPAAPSPGPSGHWLQVTLSSPSWLRIIVDGNVSMEGTFPAGTVKEFHGKRAVLRIGNAGGVEVSVDGKTIGKLGAAGDVIERSFAL